MAEKKIRLTVCTPTGTVLERDVRFVILRTVEGDMGILPGHEPCAAMLDYGVLRIFQEQEEDLLAVLGGFATVGRDAVAVLTPLAAHPGQIDEVLARLEQERAETVRREHSAEVEIQRVEMALRRVLVHTGTGALAVTDLTRRAAEKADGDGGTDEEG